VLTRQKEFLQWLVGGFSTSALIVGGVWLTDNRDYVIAAVLGEGSTSSSSVAAEPSSSLDSAKLPVLEKHSEASTSGEDRKASGNMYVSLSSPDGRKADGTLVLDANVSATTDLTDLKYEWILPEGVVLVSGAQSGSFGSLAGGAQTSTEVTLSVPTSNSHVIFHAYREMAGEKLGQVAQYNTVDQQSIDVKLALKRESLSRKPASTDRRFE